MEQSKRKQEYERKRENLIANCKKCNLCSIERCDECIIGKRLRWLESEYSDITGWTHKKWKK